MIWIEGVGCCERMELSRDGEAYYIEMTMNKDIETEGVHHA